MNKDEFLQARINEAIEKDIPQKLINFYQYSGVDAWSIWIRKFPSSVPDIITSVETDHNITRINTIVHLQDYIFEFNKIKTGEDSDSDYKNSYWNYEIKYDSRFVFGIKVKKHWAGGKPEFIEIDGYIPGEWEELFFELKFMTEEISKESARLATLEKRKINREKEELKKDRFGLK